MEGKSVLPKNAKIYVAGHRGLVGSAIVRRLQQGGYEKLVAVVRVRLVPKHLEHRGLRVAHASQRGAERRGSLEIGTGVAHGAETYPAIGFPARSW